MESSRKVRSSVGKSALEVYRGEDVIVMYRYAGSYLDDISGRLAEVTPGAIRLEGAKLPLYLDGPLRFRNGRGRDDLTREGIISISLADGTEIFHDSVAEDQLKASRAIQNAQRLMRNRDGLRGQIRG